jgi:hypothetical protein
VTSAPVRDQLDDHLITPENAAFLFIDYQPSQLATIRSMDPALLLKNAVSTVRTIKTFGVPVVHSTVNVANGQGPTLPELAALLADDKPLDRTTVNSWEDIEFVQAVHATGRRKLVCALWLSRKLLQAMPRARPLGGGGPQPPRSVGFELADLDKVEAERLDLGQHAVQRRGVQLAGEHGVRAVMPRCQRRERGQHRRAEVPADPNPVRGGCRVHAAMVAGG